MKKRDQYLHRLLGLEAPRNNDLLCQDCRQRQGLWRCLECFGSRMQCNECCRYSHRLLLLYWIESWMGTHFEPAWLWQNGLILHLGHGGDLCPGSPAFDNNSDSRESDDSNSESGADSKSDQQERDPAHILPSDYVNITEKPFELPERNCPWHRGPGAFPSKDYDVRTSILDSSKLPVLVIVDVTGIHELPVQFCTCHTHPISNNMQLVDMGLFPATCCRPKTAFTFRVLDDLRLDNLESKTSAYHYYSKLQRVTNPAFPTSVKVMLVVLLCNMIWQDLESIPGVNARFSTMAKPEIA